MTQDVKQFGEVPTDEEWSDAYRKFEAKFDTRRDEERRPKANALFTVVSIILLLSVAGYLSLQGFLAQ